ncbi:conserved hypothetical protein [Desulfosarcina cetonica]|uniref:HD domain-containing protein n=1 Tax=Desulfosarcina cetonica TaxID=90730 RepID=UPI0006D22C03|nr:HD domain-containing protein [Desulfosarcina cetonica]VTR70125.1 conserved hypothetical protein [Desulfosarcina cetonica]
MIHETDSNKTSATCRMPNGGVGLPTEAAPGATWLVTDPASAPDSQPSIVPGVLQSIRQTLIHQETTYQRERTEATFSSLWAHSSRVGRIAQHIARKEGCEEIPALLAGLMHDLGKFAYGRYHADDTPEEQNATRIAEEILNGTIYARWIPTIKDAILSTYLDGEATHAIGRVVYDADCLDKLGNLGVAQFFAKQTLRHRFLENDLLVRTSVELTYAHHAPETLKTATGRSIARHSSLQTRQFYTTLIESWNMLGLGDFAIREEEIGGVVCVLAVPRACSCGGEMEYLSDIQDTLKCRSVVVRYLCRTCANENAYTFCLPNIKGLPRRR